MVLMAVSVEIAVFLGYAVLIFFIECSGLKMEPTMIFHASNYHLSLCHISV
jgi:hypothetical protein